MKTHTHTHSQAVVKALYTPPTRRHKYIYIYTYLREGLLGVLKFYRDERVFRRIFLYIVFV